MFQVNQSGGTDKDGLHGTRMSVIELPHKAIIMCCFLIPDFIALWGSPLMVVMEQLTIINPK